MALVQYWIGIWGHRDALANNLSFVNFFLTLIPIVGLYMASVIILPVESAILSEADLIAHYKKYRRTFGGIALLIAFSYFCYGIAVLRQDWLSDESAARLFFSILFSSLVFVKNERYNEMVGVIALLLFLLFVATGVFKN